jgi:hypothetical protein
MMAKQFPAGTAYRDIRRRPEPALALDGDARDVTIA